MKNEKLNTDFRCPLHKKTKELMLKVRHFDLNPEDMDGYLSLEKDVEEIIIDILDMPIGILRNRKDLQFFLHNSKVRSSKNERLARLINEAYDIVSCAVRSKNRKVF